MDIPPLQLARAMFAASLGFHVLFAAASLALAWVLLYFKLRAHGAGRVAWLAAYRFWVRVFALTFVLALASSLPVLFQLGTVWPLLMERVGNVAGPLLAFALATVFVLKSCFLGVMLFGQRRVSEAAHTLSVAMVALGMQLLVFWLVALASWTCTPSGAVLIDGRYVPLDWRDVLLNPAMPWHLALLCVGAALIASFLIMGVVAWQALSRPLDDGERAAFRTAALLAGVALVLQFPAASGHARMAAEHLPAYAAAAAGHWKSGDPARLVLFGWPDAGQQRTRAELALPVPGASWLGRAADGTVIGLDKFSGMQPPVAAVFWSVRVAAVLAVVLLVAGAGTLALAGPALDPAHLSRRWLRVLAGTTFLGAIAVVAGWLGLHLGMQPYAVAGAVTQSEVLGPLNRDELSLGLAVQLVLYGFLLVSFVRMLFHAARYGVVPVRIPGRHA